MTTTNTTTTSVETRKEAGAEAITTALTLNWEGMTLEDTRALAQQALIVKLQGNWRKNGIPTEATINAADYKVGTRAARQPKDLKSLIAAMSPAEKAALLASLTAEG